MLERSHLISKIQLKKLNLSFQESQFFLYFCSHIRRKAYEAKKLKNTYVLEINRTDTYVSESNILIYKGSIKSVGRASTFDLSGSLNP